MSGSLRKLRRNAGTYRSDAIAVVVLANGIFWLRRVRKLWP